MVELGISPAQFESVLQSVNVLSTGGKLTIGSERITLEPSGNFNSIDDIRKTIIGIPNSTAILQLSDIAHVYRGYEDPVSVKIRANGISAISIAISMIENGNILNLGVRLNELIPEIESTLPLGIKLTPMFLQSELTEVSTDTFISNLSQAVAIVIIVMVLTLGFRTGLVIASLIPVVMISTFFVMAQFNIGIDQISLAALIIALGLLVDNGIVVVEATIVRREKGEQPIPAAIGAAKEMMLPLLISSLTTAAAFTPIALAESAVSEFTSSIFYVVTIALLLSWLISMTFIPIMTPFIKIKKSTKKSNNFDSIIYVKYRSILTSALKRPAIFGLLVVGLFMGSIYGLAYVPKVFIPPSEDPILSTSLELPAGTSIEKNRGGD